MKVQTEIEVVVDPPGLRAARRTPEAAIRVARKLLERARARVKVPYARFFVDGQLVRDKVTRTDLACDGICWCGRGALYEHDGVSFCCAKHDALWGEWSDDLRARVVVARFIGIHSGGTKRRRRRSGDERGTTCRT